MKPRFFRKAIDGPGILESTPLLLGRENTRKRQAWIRAMQLQKRRQVRLDWALTVGIALAWFIRRWERAEQKDISE